MTRRAVPALMTTLMTMLMTAALLWALPTAVSPAAVAEQGAGSGSTGLSVVNLGDSYSAGNGAGTYREKVCWRSPDNYGKQFATKIGASYVNRACSGAVVRDLTNPTRKGAPTTVRTSYQIDPKVYDDRRAEFLRRAKRDAVCGGVPAPDMYYAYSASDWASSGTLLTATLHCQLVVRPQVAGVTRGTDIVVLTVGGNNIGFSGIVVNCMVLRNASQCKSSIDFARKLVPTMTSAVKSALEVVHRRAPHAKILLLSYPMLMDRTSYSIPEDDPVYDAGAALAGLQRLGDRAAADGAAALDSAYNTNVFQFVGTIKDAWAGRGLDPRRGADNTDSWLVPIGAPGRETAEFVHPKLVGWTGTARALTKYWWQHH